MVAQRTIILGSTGPIYAIFSPNECVLGAHDRADISWDVAMATNFVEKMANSLYLLLWHSETEWDIATKMCALTA